MYSHALYQLSYQCNVNYDFTLNSNNNVRKFIHELSIHISISFQMLENLQIIMFLLYTFVLPVDLTDQGKEIILSFSILRLSIKFKTFAILGFYRFFENKIRF